MYDISHDDISTLAYVNIIHDMGYIIVPNKKYKNYLLKSKIIGKFKLSNNLFTYRITRLKMVEDEEDIPVGFKELEGTSCSDNFNLFIRCEKVASKIKLLLP